MSAETRALALAVGGARGAYQAGAMLLLAEKKIKFDALAGASIGALNGAHYVQGDGSTGHIERLIELWQSVSDVGIVQLSGETIKTAVALLLSRGLPTLSALLNRLMGRHVAILDPTPVAALLDRWIDYGKVCDSHVELTIAVLLEIEPLLDVVTAPWRRASYLRARELGPAKLQQALLAAAAIPLAFPSQEIDDRRVADAGLVDPIPAQILYQAGARRIVSIFLSDSTPQNRADFPGCLLFQIRPSIRIDTGLASVFDFSRESVDRLIDLGYQDAQASYAKAADLYEQMMEMHRRGDRIQVLADSLPNRRDPGV